MLINLFPYVDESMLQHNNQVENGIQNLWEDESNQTRDLTLPETALITKLKVESF